MDKWNDLVSRRETFVSSNLASGSMNKIVIKELSSGKYMWQCYDDDCSYGIYDTAEEAERAGEVHFRRQHVQGDSSP